MENPARGALRSKSLARPDNTVDLPGIAEAVVQIADFTIGKTIFQPGWRWSTHVAPHVETELCETHHFGLVISGRLGVTMRNGAALEIGPDEVFEIPPGHDSFTVGSEPVVMLEWAGFTLHNREFQGRVLCTLLFTDIVDSTRAMVRMGDQGWGEAIGRHHHTLQAHLERFRGREVDTAGDGLFAVFDGPAIALRCAAAIRASAQDHGLPVRIGVHVGEVELVGAKVRGAAVHEAARIMSAAEANEILVSDTTQVLAKGAGLRFKDRGSKQLKGLDEPLHIYAFTEDDSA